MNVPEIVVTPDSETPNLTQNEEQRSKPFKEDKVSSIDPSSNNSSHLSSNQFLKLHVKKEVGDPGLITPEECEKTMIQLESHTVSKETLLVCVAHLPETVLNEELLRNGCNVNGSEVDRRERLMKRIMNSVEPQINTSKKESQLPSLAWVQSIIENQLIDIKTELNSLTAEITTLKSTDPCSGTEKIEKLLDNGKKEMRQIKDLWEKNLSATTRIKNRVDEVFTEIEVAELKADEVEKSLQKLKYDLKNYYNSAFFREDGQLIREMHKVVVKPTVPDCDTSVRHPQNRSPVGESSQASTHQPTSASPLREWIHPSRLNNLQSRRGSGYTVTASPTSNLNQAPAPQTPPNQTTGAHRWRYSPSTGPSRRQTDDTRQPRSGTSTSPARTFKTILITDSILRHVQDMDTKNALGKNHELTLINKRDTSGLAARNLRNEILEVKPDFIYVHLGINDVNQNMELKETLDNILGFCLFVDESLEGTKVFLSLPLITADEESNTRIRDLRNALDTFVREINSRDSSPLKDRFLFCNKNVNFMREGHLIAEFYRDDGVHPSARGKEVILGNFRHSIHETTRMLLNKPKKTRPSRQHERST
jgi:lysophospholipase L1-like esterase